MASHLKIMLPNVDRSSDGFSESSWDHTRESLLHCASDASLCGVVHRISDPLSALGALCGMSGLATNAEGYCCLMLDHHQVVHLARWRDTARFTLSVSLSASSAGHTESGTPYGAEMMSIWRTMQVNGIRLKVLSDASLCAQLVFEGAGASGEDLLAAIDHLLAYADDWDDAVAAAVAVTLPLAQVAGSGFSYAVKRRSRCA